MILRRLRRHGVLRSIRAAAPLAIVSVATLAVCTAASVATAQVASAAKGSGVIADLVIDRLAALAVMNFFGIGAVAVATWNSTRKRVLAIASEVVSGRMNELRDYVEEVDGLVRQVSARMDDSSAERQQHAKILERIEKHITETEKRHYAEDVLARHEHPHSDETLRRLAAGEDL